MTRRFFLLLAFAPLFLIHCSSSEVSESHSAEGKFKTAEELEKDERFEEALAQYAEVKNKHPYSNLAVVSELRIADIHFKRENFVEAQNAYQLFKDFHPKHPKSDYVTYQIGLSYFHQLPDSIDRDLSLAHKSIQSFKETENSYPSSEFAKPASEKKREVLLMLAQKELYIANFYFRNDQFDSALGRYQILLNQYSGLGYDNEVLYRAALSAAKIGERERSRKLYDQLLKTAPGSSEATKIKEELSF